MKANEGECRLVANIQLLSTLAVIDASYGSPVPHPMSARISTVADQTICLLDEIVDGVVWTLFLKKRDSIRDATHSFNASRCLNGPIIAFWILAIVAVVKSAPATSTQFQRRSLPTKASGGSNCTHLRKFDSCEVHAAKSL
jgi:hypothetical protein